MTTNLQQWGYIFAFCLACFGQLYGQKQPSYVVMQDGDTLYGQIKPGTPAQRSAKIHFVRAKTKQELKFNPTEIAGWSENGVYYASKSFKLNPDSPIGMAVFMRRHTPPGAPLEYYEYFNIDAPQGAYMMHFLLHPSGEVMEVPIGFGFNKALADFLADYPELSEELKQKKYKPKELRKVVDKYNAWRQTQSQN